ncbi:MAG: priA [Haloplasmataceae bacterium]|nr:priA [Haloplasmataceae bacterium]
MIAEVIVDVKVKNVNRPFSYSVPEIFKEVIELGMRVKVPFGSREILGYVVNLKNEENEDLKMISDLLDITPSLTEELLKLAIKMAEETSSFLISCIQAMLPAAIKAKYVKKVIKLTNQDVLIQYFNKKNEVDFDMIAKSDYALVKKLINSGDLDIIYEVKDKLKIKYDTYVLLSNHFSEHINKNAKKQTEVIEYMLTLNEPILKNQLLKYLNLSNSTYKTLLDKQIIEEIVNEVYRDPYSNYEGSFPRHKMNDEQEFAYTEIVNSIKEAQEEVFLLHGITGSGKTEIYLNVIEDVIHLGREAIMLVPEISLTPQIVKRFKARFGDLVAVLHSGLSLGEKYDEWRKIRSKTIKVVVGARSAVFAPLTNIGIIIIDEEHESSYKQDEMPKYHAVEVAKDRAKNHHATVILGSATPSLESYARAIKKVYHLLELTKRATNSNLPHAEIVNMTEEHKYGNLSIVSDKLYKAIIDRLSKNEQIILLLNRRGYDNFLMCRSCGYTVMCKNCDITLTYHKSTKKLKCHYCGYEETEISKCPKCGGEHLKGFGYGTEKVEEELYNLFPGVRIIRMDVDTTGNKGDHERLLEAFEHKEADILLGTQMIAKGLDFEDVTLVGVLSADTVLKLPDYKSSEKTFQLVTQVAGRAGRHKDHSDVFIQTYNPEHYSIVLAAENNYKGFFNQEMKLRKIGKYVPYYFMTQIVVTDENFSEAMKEANKIVQYLIANLSNEVIILGPVVPQIKRVNNVFQTQIIIKYKHEPNLKKALENILITYNNKKVNIIIDMYPNFLL